MPISDRITDDAAASVITPVDVGLGSHGAGFNALVADRVSSVRERVAEAQRRSGRDQAVTLIAVTKTHGPEAVDAAWAAGIVDVGENKVQEAEAKRLQTKAPVRWHLIGHLQRNKAKAAAAFDMVHGVDSVRLAEALNAAAREAERVIDVLVQVNISGESSKSGFTAGDIAMVAAALEHMPQLRVGGVMTMAPFDASEATLRHVFAGARRARDELALAGHPATYLSMGMSGDFEMAVEEGATHLRLGTILFGDRAHH